MVQILSDLLRQIAESTNSGSDNWVAIATWGVVAATIALVVVQTKNDFFVDC